MYIFFKQVPQFEEFVDKQDEDNIDIGTHLLMAAFCRFYESIALKASKELLEKIAIILNYCYARNMDTTNQALFISFFEGMDKKYFDIIAPHLCEKLLVEAQDYRKQMGTAF